jgi:2-methylcitrate dehydratase PrpD
MAPLTPVPLTRAIAEFIAGLRFDQCPAEAVRMVCNGVTDVTACMILGRDMPVVRIIRQAAITPGDEARLCFGAERAGAADAALLNGTAAHAHDYDDIGIGAHPAHPSAVLAPAILAVAEARGCSGRDMIAAYVAGYEVWGELARRDADPHHVKGLHPTGVFGAVAAAAACASLLGLDAKRASHAVGLAATQAAGLVVNFGSMAKPFHAGRAAQVGVLSARLAEAGMTAAPDGLEQPQGFLHAVSPRGRVDLASPLKLGSDWWLLSNGLGFKLYPMCYGTHRSLDGMLQLACDNAIAPESVTDVEVEMSKNQQLNLVNHDPQTANEAKFSEEFAMAMAIIARRATRAEIADAFVRRDDVRALMKKVRITTIPGVGHDRPSTPPADRVTVTLADGRRLQRRLDHPRGHPERPLVGEELRTKFADCVGDALSPASARALFDCLQALEHLRSVDDLPVIGGTEKENKTMVAGMAAGKARLG